MEIFIITIVIIVWALICNLIVDIWKIENDVSLLKKDNEIIKHKHKMLSRDYRRLRKAQDKKTTKRYDFLKKQEQENNRHFRDIKIIIVGNED